jgi:pimeloyl-ACP methyl ester carboxylesterase
MRVPPAKTISTDVLEIAYEESGPANGPPVILLHGFPDDVRAWDSVVPPLADAGMRVLVPWLRGYGPTRFLRAATPRSGQQAALAADLHGFMDALGIDRALLAGYDWGGRAACVVSVLWPERVAGLVSINGYNLQNIPVSSRPADPLQEYRYWYQWYFHTKRGRNGLAENRRELCRLLWRLWSPNWHFDDATYERTAASFDNPDFVDVVVQSYRHRYHTALGDPELDWIEGRLEGQPPITVASVVLHGMADGVDPPTETDHAADHFTGPYRRELVPVAGHFLPREAPEAVVRALLELHVDVLPSGLREEVAGA